MKRKMEKWKEVGHRGKGHTRGGQSNLTWVGLAWLPLLLPPRTTKQERQQRQSFLLSFLAAPAHLVNLPLRDLGLLLFRGVDSTATPL
jgi:hypothetical protein